MFKKTISSVLEIPPKTIPEHNLNQTPAFYKSMANDAFISKFKNQEVNENFPFIVEYIEGSVVLNSQGKNTDTITFIKQVHDLPPIIEGMLFQPDLGVNVMPIQTTWTYNPIDDFMPPAPQVLPLFSGIGLITKNNFTFNIQTSMTETEDFGDYSLYPTTIITNVYPFAGQFVKYKLWILRLNI